MMILKLDQKKKIIVPRCLFKMKFEVPSCNFVAYKHLLLKGLDVT